MDGWRDRWMKWCFTTSFTICRVAILFVSLYYKTVSLNEGIHLWGKFGLQVIQFPCTLWSLFQKRSSSELNTRYNKQEKNKSREIPPYHVCPSLCLSTSLWWPCSFAQFQIQRQPWQMQRALKRIPRYCTATDLIAPLPW